MPIDRALIVKSPYAKKIVAGIKSWEMRSLKTKVRGRVGVIESGTGLIIGAVNIVDCLPAINQDQAKMTFHKHHVEDTSLLQKWKFPWVLDQAEKYDEPIPYDHPKGAVIWVKLF